MLEKLENKRGTIWTSVTKLITESDTFLRRSPERDTIVEHQGLLSEKKQMLAVLGRDIKASTELLKCTWTTGSGGQSGMIQLLRMKLHLIKDYRPFK